MSDDTWYPREQITAAIIAGGKGHRMGDRDKGLLELNGQPMISYIIARLQNQVGRIIINANRNHDSYAAFGYPIISDHKDGYLGPLAGIESALLATETSYMLCVPCDSPLLPDDLGLRLYTAMQTSHTRLAAVHDGTRLQPMHALYSHGLLPDLQTFLASGKRKVEQWFDSQRYARANYSHNPHAFTNVNTTEERFRLEAEIGKG